MSRTAVDADLGPFEERILREASDEFWRYVARSARIAGGTTIERASRISGLSSRALRKLAGVHWLLSEEVDALLDALPTVLSRLSRRTTALPGAGPEVRGAIDWSATMAARARTGWRVPTFVYSEAQAEADTPANRVLKATLESIVSGASAYTRDLPELTGDGTESSRWVRELSRRSATAIRAVRHPGLEHVRAPARLSEHDLRVCAAEAARGYRRAAAAARLRRALVEREEPRAVESMLRRRVLVPAQRFRLFEVWILARIAAFFRAGGFDEGDAPLLSDAQSAPVYRFRQREGTWIDVFFQGAPVVMRRASIYKDIFRAYDLDVSGRTPDIVVQFGVDGEAPRLLIEAKASDDARYVADGAYKLLGYAADFADALPEPNGALPAGLLVTKSVGAYNGQSRSGHRIWIANVDSLDATLRDIFQIFLGRGLSAQA